MRDTDREDGRRAPFLQVNFNIEDVRLLYNAVDFYLENRPVSGARPPTQQEPTAHCEAMKKALYSMLMEYQYHSQDLL